MREEHAGLSPLFGAYGRKRFVVALVALGAALAAGFTALLAFAAPTWAQTSSDPGRIVFVSNRDYDGSSSNPTDIYTMKPDGTDVKRVTDFAGGAVSRHLARRQQDRLQELWLPRR